MGSSPGEGDIFDRLRERRIVFVRDPLDAAEANRIIREIDLKARGLLRLRAQLNELLAHHTAQALERIERDIDRGLTLNAEEARAYGLIDDVAGGR